MVIRLHRWNRRLLSVSAGLLLCAGVGCTSTGSKETPNQGPKLAGSGGSVISPPAVMSSAYSNPAIGNNQGATMQPVANYANPGMMQSRASNVPAMPAVPGAMMPTAPVSPAVFGQPANYQAGQPPYTPNQTVQPAYQKQQPAPGVMQQTSAQPLMTPPPMQMMTPSPTQLQPAPMAFPSMPSATPPVMPIQPSSYPPSTMKEISAPPDYKSGPSLMTSPAGQNLSLMPPSLDDGRATPAYAVADKQLRRVNDPSLNMPREEVAPAPVTGPTTTLGTFP